MKKIKLCNLNDSYLDSYDRIIKADLVCEDITYNNCYILVGNDIPEELEVELTGGLWFNTEYEKENVEVVKDVSCLQDILDFCREKGIEIEPNRLGKNFVLVGGSVDTLILPNLKSYCIYDVLYTNRVDTTRLFNINKYLKIDIEKNNDVYLKIKELNNLW